MWNPVGSSDPFSEVPCDSDMHNFGENIWNNCETQKLHVVGTDGYLKHLVQFENFSLLHFSNKCKNNVENFSSLQEEWRLSLLVPRYIVKHGLKITKLKAIEIIFY